MCPNTREGNRGQNQDVTELRFEWYLRSVGYMIRAQSLLSGLQPFNAESPRTVQPLCSRLDTFFHLSRLLWLDSSSAPCSMIHLLTIIDTTIYFVINNLLKNKQFLGIFYAYVCFEV